jgi:GNAT superfamily N-acetyltransferase
MRDSCTTDLQAVRMEQAWTVRLARPGDGAELAAMVLELARFEKLESQVQLTAERAEEVLTGADPHVRAWVVESNGRLAAYAVCYRTFSTFNGRHGLYLEDLYVRPQWRGRGIGRAILKHLAQICVEERAGRLEWTVLNWNVHAREVYRSLGAKELAEWILNRLEGEAILQAAEGLDPLATGDDRLGKSELPSTGQ